MSTINLTDMTNTAVDLYVAGRIRHYRQRSGFTLSHMAILLEDISFQQLQKYESGANRVCCSRLFQIARVLSVPVSNFFPKAILASADNVSLSEEIDIQSLLDDNPHKKEIYYILTALMQVDSNEKRIKLLSLCQHLIDSLSD